MLAAPGHHAHELVGVLREPAMMSRAPEAALARPRTRRRLLVRLEVLRGRQARIAAALRRLVQKRLKLRHPTLEFSDALLGRDGASFGFLAASKRSKREGFQLFARQMRQIRLAAHGEVDSHPPSSHKPSPDQSACFSQHVAFRTHPPLPPQAARPFQGGEQLPHLSRARAQIKSRAAEK